MIYTWYHICNVHVDLWSNILCIFTLILFSILFYWSVSFLLCLLTLFYLFYLLIFYCSSYYNCPNFSPFCSLHWAPLIPSGILTAVFHVHGSCVYVLWLIPSFFQLVPFSPFSSYSCRSVSHFYASDSILLISLYCSFDSTYKWD